MNFLYTKTLPILIFTLAIFSTSKAQNNENVYQGHHSYFTIGSGLLHFESGGIPIWAAVEQGLNDYLSIGAGASYHAYKSGQWAYETTQLVGRGSLHFSKLFKSESDIDFYTGFCLGYQFVDSRFNNPQPTTLKPDLKSDVYLGPYAGLRMHLFPHTQINIELGCGIHAFGLGITYKL